MNGATPDRLARAGVCTIPEGRGVFPNLTVRENLEMMTFTGKSLDVIEEQAYAQFKRLAERRSQLAGTLSGGEQQMLALARGLTTDPALLLLDELSMGLAPLVVEEIYVDRRAGSPARACRCSWWSSSRGRSWVSPIWRRSWCTDASSRSVRPQRSRITCRRPISGIHPQRTVEQRHDRGSTELMDEKHDRIDEFKQEIADMRIRPPEDSSERMPG